MLTQKIYYSGAVVAHTDLGLYGGHFLQGLISKALYLFANDRYVSEYKRYLMPCYVYTPDHNIIVEYSLNAHLWLRLSGVVLSPEALTKGNAVHSMQQYNNTKHLQ